MKEFEDWEKEIKKNSYSTDLDFRHLVAFYHFEGLEKELEAFSDKIILELEPLVAENHLSENLPKIVANEQILHHPSYSASGNIIYSSRMLSRMAKKGGLLEGLLFFFLSSQAGEAGHNCPIACSYGILRVLQKMEDFPNKSLYLEKLIAPSYDENFTGAQFVTEVQGGSDVGANAVIAKRDAGGNWRITGEKWFCSNADAELILVTARYNQKVLGTKGVGLFLVPAKLDSGERNSYLFRKLKDKLGTRSLATAEIEFSDAYALPVGKPEEGFKILMENVLHSSRIFNSVCVLGMARRAYQIAFAYAKHREAFGRPILQYPMVQENLARIKAENTALLAMIFATVKLQDQYDLGEHQNKHLLSLLANLNKYLSALWTVQHIHHCLDVLAGNGTIETFSSIPRLFRDSIICENWEGTHNVLRMQILKDILRYGVDEIFLGYLDAVLPENLKEKRNELGVSLKELKQAPEELQLLLIKPCVDQMGILFAASHLYLEAMDQQKSGNSSKVHCFHYFSMLHLEREGKMAERYEAMKAVLNIVG